MAKSNMNNELISSFLLSETARLNSSLIKNGISSKSKRKSICEDYLFDFCNFMDEGIINNNNIDYFVLFQFNNKRQLTSYHEIVLSIIDDYFQNRNEIIKNIDTEPSYPDPNSESPTLAFRIVLKPFKKNTINIAIFKNATDKSIISMIKQNIVGHLWLLGVVDSPNNKTIYKNMKTDIPIIQIHQSLKLENKIQIEFNNKKSTSKYCVKNLENITIDDILEIARLELKNL